MLVGLIGLPNSGKSALFNALTHNRQRIANFPGITVEKRIGSVREHEKEIQIVDLPGIYTLDVTSLDEKVTKDYIFRKVSEEAADIFVLVVDATNLKKSIYLGLQLKELGINFVVALNMVDLAKRRGQVIDLEKLSQELGGVEIIETVAVEEKGTHELLAKLAKNSGTTDHEYPQGYQKAIKEPSYIKEKLKEVDRIYSSIVLKKISHDSLTDKVDSLVLHPILGPVVLLGIFLFIFQLLFAWSDPFMGAIEYLFEMAGTFVSQTLPDGYIKSLIVDGIISGVGGILVFLPHIVFLFVIIHFLEDVGYLGRAAFMLDYIMRKVGLPGKSVVPLLSSHACAIPGIMSTRIIENPFQRTLTMMVSPLMTCSARLPVYTLLIGVIVPNQSVLGFLKLPGLVLFGLYIFGILSAFAVAFLARKAFPPSSPGHLLMELPPYRVPKLINVLRSAAQKGWVFIKKAGSIILVLSIIIWGLVTFPGAPEKAELPAIHYSYAAQIGKTFEPVFRPMGFDWKITTALIPSFGAREVLVAAMGTVYALESEDTEDETFIMQLSEILRNQYSLGTLMALLIWFVFSPQCIATFGVLKKETGGYKLPIIFCSYTLALAYIFSFITYLIF